MRLWISVSAALAALMLTIVTHADEVASPVYGITLPDGYRNWELVSIASIGSPVSDLRAKLGNDIAMKAFRERTIPYPDGSIIVRLAYKQVMNAEGNELLKAEAIRQGLSPAAAQKLVDGSVVAGPPTNVQIMVKDSKKYASTGGWGFAQFTNGKPDSAAIQNTCWSCHAPGKSHDFVFTTYAQ